MQRPAANPPGSATDIPPMYSASQLRLLRIAVIVMGIVLLLGFATVIGRIVYLLNAAPKPAPDASEGSVAASAPLGSPVALALPKGAVVRHLALSGNRLAIHYESPAGAGIRIVDLVSPERSLTFPIVEATSP
ncbi:MAG: hypothetical protein AB7L90_15280 [Hyphomicrobiaceae bacterium]